MDDIEQLIDTISTQDFSNANPIFQEIMATKIQDALDTEKIKVAGMMFDDIEISDEDLEDIDLNDEEFDTDEDNEDDEE